MALMTATEFAKNIPGSPHLTAIEAMADIYRTLSPEAAEDWVALGQGGLEAGHLGSK